VTDDGGQTRLIAARCKRCGRMVAFYAAGGEEPSQWWRFARVENRAGKFRFHLKAPNGEIIAASQGYETKANAEKGIEAIKTHAPGAKVEDHSAT
jgi:uncharacterized protein YegP (UPF0339 family)